MPYKLVERETSISGQGTNVTSFCTGVVIKSQSSWGASAPRAINKVRSHVQYVIIHHTKNANGCSESEHCQQLIRNIQKAHKRRNFVDIGYNFIVAGDGNVYKGRGFGIAGQHASTYNYNSIGIGFLGDFENELPSEEMLDNAKKLIKRAISEGYLKSDYILWGHRQEKSTTCPGTALFNEIKTWPHWSQWSD